MTKVLSFYLPQFHPIPENDKWWGKGFTEWSNVAQAKPRFKKHHQPHIPSDLGFYDLRLSETRQAQADLAKKYGIDGFCYYHYWFNGNQLLDRPLREVLVEKDPDFPFCMCWANENWTRAWDGLDREILIAQNYTQEDSLEHINELIKYFLDYRYIKVDGRPFFLVYRPDHIPESKEYFSIWRDRAEKAGLPGLYICAVKGGFVEFSDSDLLDMGYDAIIDFQPDRRDFPIASTPSQALVDIARKTLPDRLFQFVKNNASAINSVDYKAMVENMTSRTWPKDYRKFPVVFPSWDNTARRKTPTIIQNLDPEIYSRWLQYAVESVSEYPENEAFVFVNAWNEWAEGCHLEPDKKVGHGFLQATKRVIDSSKKV
ncbi:glycosyltransferase WbsX family protein [Halomonas sp. AOP22-C1-8]|uniref:glycosyltransferase WbsX family protein n=1 Tax=Halomonas sp. AOP22-C1-8 TaxID=3457717 RepID=UPI004033DF1F